MVRPTLDVGGGVLGGISTALLAAAEDLDATGGGSPASIDAGPWTGLVTAMVTRVTEASAVVAETVGQASQAVLEADATFTSADEAARGSLTPRSGVGAR